LQLHVMSRTASALKENWHPESCRRRKAAQFLCAPQALRQQPLQRRGPGLLQNAAVQCACARCRPACNVFELQGLVEVLRQPAQQRLQRLGRRRRFAEDELACPPSRSRGNTASLAASAATAAPWSQRTMCRHRSSPAAAPAEVNICPLSTKSTFGSTVTPGYLLASCDAANQCAVARRPSSRPGTITVSVSARRLKSHGTRMSKASALMSFASPHTRTS